MPDAKKALAFAAENMPTSNFSGFYEVGHGIDFDTADLKPSPYLNLTEDRRTPGDGVVNDTMVYRGTSQDLDTAIQLDVKMEAKWLAIHGSLSTDWQNQTAEAKKDIAFSTASTVDYGTFQIDTDRTNLKPEAQLALSKGVAYFKNIYGTHLVVGTQRIAYVVAKFSVSQISAKSRSQLTLSVDGGGNIGIVGFSGAANLQATLEEVSRATYVNVSVQSTVNNGSFGAVIRDPGNVTTILGAIAAKVAALNTSTGVPARYIIEPWGTFYPELAAPPIIIPDFYDEQLNEYVKCNNMTAKLDDITTKPFYSFLGDDYLQELKTSNMLLKSRMTEIRNRLTTWQNGATPVHIDFDPIVVAWPMPKVESRTAGYQPNDVDYNFKLYGGNGFLFRAINTATSRTETGGVDDLTGYPEKHTCHAEVYVPRTGLIFGDWVVQATNQTGEPIVEIPLPQPPP